MLRGCAHYGSRKARCRRQRGTTLRGTGIGTTNSPPGTTHRFTGADGMRCSNRGKNGAQKLLGKRGKPRPHPPAQALQLSSRKWTLLICTLIVHHRSTCSGPEGVRQCLRKAPAVLSAATSAMPHTEEGDSEGNRAPATTGGSSGHAAASAGTGERQPAASSAAGLSMHKGSLQSSFLTRSGLLPFEEGVRV